MTSNSYFSTQIQTKEFEKSKSFFLYCYAEYLWSIVFHFNVKNPLLFHVISVPYLVFLAMFCIRKAGVLQCCGNGYEKLRYSKARLYSCLEKG